MGTLRSGWRHTSAEGDGDAPVFFLWQLCLRSFCLFLVWGREWGGARVGAAVPQLLGVCLRNLIKWVVFMVYYCDCKKRFL
ncbi:hypothetical protein CRG98_045272 [Punica granatum]|uniref:Uncharacterized protein n=1 Tax=Punica granatum TaxID=22663 RepID=A0A2I0HSV4_PUNGR|nr:hypothetical protein CRG98_045272 [Punica granatum]